MLTQSFTLSVSAIVVVAAIAIGLTVTLTTRIPARTATPVESKCEALGIDESLSHKCEYPYTMPQRRI